MNTVVYMPKISYFFLSTFTTFNTLKNNFATFLMQILEIKNSQRNLNFCTFIDWPIMIKARQDSDMRQRIR